MDAKASTDTNVPTVIGWWTRILSFLDLRELPRLSRVSKLVRGTICSAYVARRVNFTYPEFAALKEISWLEECLKRSVDHLETITLLGFDEGLLIDFLLMAGTGHPYAETELPRVQQLIIDVFRPPDDSHCNVIRLYCPTLKYLELDRPRRSNKCNIIVIAAQLELGYVALDQIRDVKFTLPTRDNVATNAMEASARRVVLNKKLQLSYVRASRVPGPRATSKAWSQRPRRTSSKRHLLDDYTINRQRLPLCVKIIPESGLMPTRLAGLKANFREKHRTSTVAGRARYLRAWWDAFDSLWPKQIARWSFLLVRSRPIRLYSNADWEALHQIEDILKMPDWLCLLPTPRAEHIEAYSNTSGLTTQPRLLKRPRSEITEPEHSASTKRRALDSTPLLTLKALKHTGTAPSRESDSDADESSRGDLDTGAQGDVSAEDEGDASVSETSDPDDERAITPPSIPSSPAMSTSYEPLGLSPRPTAKVIRTDAGELPLPEGMGLVVPSYLTHTPPHEEGQKLIGIRLSRIRELLQKQERGKCAAEHLTWTQSCLVYLIGDDSGMMAFHRTEISLLDFIDAANVTFLITEAPPGRAYHIWDVYLALHTVWATTRRRVRFWCPGITLLPHPFRDIWLELFTGQYTRRTLEDGLVAIAPQCARQPAWQRYYEVKEARELFLQTVPRDEYHRFGRPVRIASLYPNEKRLWREWYSGLRLKLSRLPRYPVLPSSRSHFCVGWFSADSPWYLESLLKGDVELLVRWRADSIPLPLCRTPYDGAFRKLFNSANTQKLRNFIRAIALAMHTPSPPHNLTTFNDELVNSSTKETDTEDPQFDFRIPPENQFLLRR